MVIMLFIIQRVKFYCNVMVDEIEYDFMLIDICVILEWLFGQCSSLLLYYMINIRKIWMFVFIIDYYIIYKLMYSRYW